FNGGTCGWDKNCDWLQFGTKLETEEWNHLALTRGTDGRISFYLNGEPIGAIGADMMNLGNTFSNTSYPIRIGAVGANSGVDWEIDGGIDDITLWNRTLPGDEIREMYVRGTGKMRFQVRSCDDDACAGEEWVGPDGTSGTFFSEALNTGA